MGARLVSLLGCVLLGASLAHAQAPAAGDGIERLLGRLQQIVQAGDRPALDQLIEQGTLNPDEIEQFAGDILREGVLRAIVRERDRGPIDGQVPDHAYRLLVEFFTETAGRARIVTMMLGVRRPDGGGPETWRIAGVQPMRSVEGLYRLRVNPSVQFAARDLTIAAEDLSLTLQDGSVFPVEGEQGITGLVLFGRGIMRFTPAPRTEQGQLRIFSGAESLTAPFDTAFIRVSPSDYRRLVNPANLQPTAVNPRELRRAQELLAEDGPKSFSIDLSELSPDIWYLLPTSGDFLAEVRTARHGNLTYARSGAQPEDITLFDRGRRRTIALYPSADRIASRGRSFNEDDLREYDVLDYDVEATVTPVREFIQGRARLRLRVRADALASLTFRLADSLAVATVVTEEHGRLLPLRIRGQNAIIVNLPEPLARDTEIVFVISYSGPMTAQDIEVEGLQVQGQNPDEPLFMAPERNFLLSNRSFWYPQNPITDYATATLRITVPDGVAVVASGEPSTDVALRDLVTPPQGRAYVFRASEPLRYLALVISRFVRVSESTVATAAGDAVRMTIDTNPRQQARGRALTATAGDIVKFYAGLLGDAPYSSVTVAVVENELPGGHSPGYFAMLNTQLPFGPQLAWRNDPAAFVGFPDFFLAHELAHQWWGQAVGWRNYHEQWISEGFAQYFAALYAQQTRGDETFVGMLRQFSRWAVAESDEGPVSLGYRLGHLKDDTQVFRALVYNKGAAVLHMLRRLLGDETFFNGLRRFYAAQKFQKTGTEDFRRAMEAESGRTLERFFEQWIYGTEIPRIRYSTTIVSGAVNLRFEQLGGVVDIPVTVSILYADGRTQDVMVPLTERVATPAIPTTGTVRQVQVNRDSAAVAEFTADR